MIEIKDLLFSINNTLLKQELKKEIIKSVISRVLGIPITLDNIDIKNGTIYLNIKPIYKNEIFLKREQIFFEIERELGIKTPKNIR